MQETHSTEKSQRLWSSQWGRKIYFSHGTSNARGVAILFNWDLPIEIHNTILDENGRFLLMYSTYKQTKLLLVNIYALNKDEPHFFQALFQEVGRFSPDHVVLAGNLNVALNPDMDCKGSFCNNNRSMEVVNSFLEANELFDAWRHFNPELKEFTWRKLKPKPSFSRLDYFLVSGSMEQFIDKVSIHYSFCSDHSLVKMVLKLDPHERGPGYWKFNNLLLKDPDYLDKINKLIDIELAQPFESHKQKWVTLKLAIRGSTLQYAARKQKSNRNKIIVLEQKLTRLERELCEGSLFTDTEEQIRLVKHDLQEIVKQKTLGAMIRS